MLLPLSVTATTGQGTEQVLVSAKVQWRQFQPLLHEAEALTVRGAIRETLEQRDAPGVEASTLRQQPTRELRTAIDVEPFEKGTAERLEQSTRPLRRKSARAGAAGALYFARIDEAVR